MPVNRPEINPIRRETARSHSFSLIRNFLEIPTKKAYPSTLINQPCHLALGSAGPSIPEVWIFYSDHFRALAACLTLAVSGKY